MVQLTRRLFGVVLPFLATQQPAFSEDLSTTVRRAIVRSAQIADQIDSVWQQVAGEVVPTWQRPQALSTSNIPPASLDEAFAGSLLSIPLEVGAQCCGLSVRELELRMPKARREAVLLYGDSQPAPAPLNNEPLYVRMGSSEPSGAPGTATRGFSRALATAAERGEFVSNSTLFNYEAYCTWRVLQAALSDSRSPAERKRLQRCFGERLGAALLHGPLALAALPPVSPEEMKLPRAERSLCLAVDGCDALLRLMQERGLFSRYQVSLQGMGSGTDLFDESDWQAGGSTLWTFAISGSTVIGASQLAQDRTAATGLGAGLYPGQVITAPLASYLGELGIPARIDEYFLDNRVGRPDPRTFSDPSYYSDVLLEVVALASDA
eukprot:scaffold4549_cov136-Isochrysis_galbana.AAC.6